MKTKRQPSERLKNLISRAKEVAGNGSKLAVVIADTKHNVSSWMSGNRPCPVEAQILMAQMTGSDVNDTIRDHLLEKPARSSRKKLLISKEAEVLVKTGKATIKTSVEFRESF